MMKMYVEIDVKGLANRLSKALCFKNEDAGSKWLYLDPADVSLAVSILENLSNSDKTET